MSEFAQVSRRLAGAAETAAANRSWWDAEAADYYAEHGRFLGDADFVWGPEGWRESELRLLGEVAGRRVLEIGAGAGQCSRWLATQGAAVVATDLSRGMLRTALTLNQRVSDSRRRRPAPPVRRAPPCPSARAASTPCSRHTVRCPSSPTPRG